MLFVVASCVQMGTSIPVVGAWLLSAAFCSAIGCSEFAPWPFDYYTLLRGACRTLAGIRIQLPLPHLPYFAAARRS